MARERYNTLVRERYGASGRLFDIARVESTTPSAERTTGEYEGRSYYPWTASWPPTRATSTTLAPSALLRSSPAS
jgi:hypothetical protein